MIKELFNWNHPILFNQEKPLYIWLNFCNITLITMLVIIDLLSSVMVMTQMQGAFAIDSTKTIWLGKSFFFLSTIATLISDPLAGRYGYKKLLFIGNCLFSIGSVGTGLATTFETALFFRIISGLGGGTLITIGLTLIKMTIPQKQQTKAIIAYSNLFFGLGIALGLLIGGYIGQMGHWNWVFFFNLYLSLPTLLLTYLLIPETPLTKKSSFDYIGLVTLSLFLFFLLLIVTQVKAPWNTQGSSSLFIQGCSVGALSFFLIFSFHSLSHKNPIIDLSLFKKSPFAIGAIGLIIVSFMVFGMTLVLIGFLETIYLYQRDKIGIFVSMVGFIYLIFGALTALLSKWIRPLYFIIGGFLLIIVSSFLHQMMTIQSTPLQIGTLLAIHSTGIAIVLGPLTSFALNPFKEEASSPATLLSFIRLAAATFGSGLIELTIQLRTPFHRLRFGEQIDPTSSAYQKFSHKLNQHLEILQGEYTSMKQTTNLIISWAENQAKLLSFNDAIYILGWLTLIALLLILFFTRAQKKVFS